MATHWGISGQPNGYMSKFWGAFFTPLLAVIMFGLLMIVPTIDPLRQNIEKFRKFYDGFILLMVTFMLYIHILVLLWNLEVSVNMSVAIFPAMGVLFYYLGILMEHAKRNWFIGIRTPWTLSSDNVWDKTHKLGSKLFKAAGVLAFFGFLLPGAALFVIVGPLILFSLYLILYSFLEFRKEGQA